jgi:hypothetical protein
MHLRLFKRGSNIRDSQEIGKGGFTEDEKTFLTYIALRLQLTYTEHWSDEDTRGLVEDVMKTYKVDRATATKVVAMGLQVARHEV